MPTPLRSITARAEGVSRVLSNTYRKGRAGEDAAALHLQKKGYRILARNFRCRTGEVDIICEADTLLLFVEVKSWHVLRQDALGASIGPDKQARIGHAARYYLYRNPREQEREIRFDVVFVNPKAGTIRHIEGAFEIPCHE